MSNLYRLYDADDRLLYVGRSLNTARRLSEHRAKHWWSTVARIHVEHYDAGIDVGRLEHQAIQREEPAFNVAGRQSVTSKSVSTAEYQRKWRAKHGARTGVMGRPEKPAPPCGTVKAYRRHVRRGEPVDDACKAAWAEYFRSRRKQ